MIRRLDTVYVTPIFEGDNLVGFRTVNRQGDVTLSENDDYIIYVTTAILRRNGVISGIYLGTLTENQIILEKDKKVVYNKEKGYIYNGERIQRGRLVIIDNLNKEILIPIKQEVR